MKTAHLIWYPVLVAAVVAGLLFATGTPWPEAVIVLVLLACPVMMLLMVIGMDGNHVGQDHHPEPPSQHDKTGHDRTEDVEPRALDRSPR